MIKLILNQDVPNLGTTGDIVEVKDGYARNYLLPRKMATRWTKGAEKQIVTMRKARRAREIASADDARAVREILQGKALVVPVRAGAGGRLFGTVTAADVVAAVKAAGGPDLDRRRVDIPGHIKNVGDHEVVVRLHTDIQAKVTVKVVPAE